MTMEMWDLGQTMGRFRLALFIALTALVVFGLSRFADFLNFTLAGYGIALIVSLHVLWTFGRIGGDFPAAIRSVAVVGFPAAIGAALARLVV